MTLVRVAAVSAPAGGGSGAAAAADSSRSRPDPFYIGLASAVLVGGVVGGGLLTEWLDPQQFTPVQGVGMFAVFYAVAQALERFFEFTRLIFPQIGATKENGVTKRKEEAENEANAALARVVNLLAAGESVTTPEGHRTPIEDAAKKKKTLERVAANTTVIAWAVNSAVAALLVGALGLYFLTAIGVKDVHPWLDIGISSLVVGGGTKPLHDLIKNIEKAKEEKKQPIA